MIVCAVLAHVGEMTDAEIGAVIGRTGQNVGYLRRRAHALHAVSVAAAITKLGDCNG